MSRQVNVRCPICGNDHLVSPGELIGRMSVQGLSEEQLKERTKKATIARLKKLSPVKKKK